MESEYDSLGTWTSDGWLLDINIRSLQAITCLTGESF